MAEFQIVSRNPRARGTGVIATGFASREIAAVAAQAIDAAYPPTNGWVTYVERVPEEDE